MKKYQENKYRKLENHTVLNDMVLVEPISFEDEDEVYRPEQYEDKPSWGVVIGVGKGRTLDNGHLLVPDVEVGSLVTFNEYLSTKLRSLGKDYLFVRYEDLLTVTK